MLKEAKAILTVIYVFEVIIIIITIVIFINSFSFTTLTYQVLSQTHSKISGLGLGSLLTLEPPLVTEGDGEVIHYQRYWTDRLSFTHVLYISNTSGKVGKNIHISL